MDAATGQILTKTDDGTVHSAAAAINLSQQQQAERGQCVTVTFENDTLVYNTTGYQQVVNPAEQQQHVQAQVSFLLDRSWCTGNCDNIHTPICKNFF